MFQEDIEDTNRALLMTDTPGATERKEERKDEEARSRMKATRGEELKTRQETKLGLKKKKEERKQKKMREREARQ